MSDSENARTLTCIWREHEPSKLKIDSNSVNFVSLNCKASTKRNASAQLVNEMAKSVKLKQATAQKSGKGSKPKDQPVSDTPKDQVYGLPSVKDVAIKDLVQNKFGNDGETETTETYKKYFEMRMQEGKAHTTVKQTRASLGRSETLRILQSKEIKEPFKMSKFKKVESKIKLHEK